MENDIISVSICARTETAKFKHGDYSHMLSLLDPNDVGDGIVVPSSAQHLGRLMFDDLDDIEVRAPKYCSYIPPRQSDVLRIMEFFQHLRSNQGTGVLIHCEAGISRSTAAAIIGLCALELKPEAAFEYVIDLVAMGLPNRRMLRLADEVLGERVKLATLAENHRRALFERYNQPDPLQLLKAKLDQKSRTALRLEVMRHWAKYAMRNLRLMLSAKRLKTRKPSQFIKRVGNHFGIGSAGTGNLSQR